MKYSMAVSYYETSPVFVEYPAECDLLLIYEYFTVTMG